MKSGDLVALAIVLPMITACNSKHVTQTEKKAQSNCFVFDWTYVIYLVAEELPFQITYFW